MRTSAMVVCAVFGLMACSSSDDTAPGDDASVPDSTGGADAGRDATRADGGTDASHGDDATSGDDDATTDGTVGVDTGSGDDAETDALAQGDTGPACTTHVTYGGAWIHGGNHPNNWDDAAGNVTWDGTCTDDGANSYAVLSNGWKPYFTGHSACAIGLDTSHCGGPTTCATRVTYGAAWQPAANHPNSYDDIGDRVLWDGLCTDSSPSSYATLSNGWQPHFNGTGACALSLRYTQCGGVYANSVSPDGCADPGVLHDGSQYVVACTSGNATDAFALRTSTDLVNWTNAGHIFASAAKPTWAKSDFWAPEIHKVGSGYVAYFTARHTDGQLSIGAAKATSALGPYTDVGAPLVHQASMGSIDATEFETAAGDKYLLWKDDGNAQGKPTPIHAQKLAADGVTLTGTDTVLITNDKPWEGGVVEGPWMIAHGGEYFLFYSGNSYANGTYAIGVARGASPMGPFTKAAGPLVTTKGNWVGPGHCSVVDAPNGDTTVVYHAWKTGHVNGPGDARLLLVDRLLWGNDGWPTSIAPSTGTVAAP